MDFPGELLRYGFFSNALAACVLSGLLCGMIGTYVVSRRIVLLSGGITHSSFGGIGIAYYFGLDPIMGAAVFAVLSALGIEWASGRGKVREDSAIGIVWSIGMAVGIIFVYMTPGYAPNLMSFLFGNVLTVTPADITALAILSGVVLLLFAFFMRTIIYAAFDRDYSRSRGVPAGFISCFMAVVVALTIVFSIRTVGIVLLISLLTIPAVIANSFTRSYAGIMVWSGAIAIAGNIAGLSLSFTMNIPAGAATIFVLAVALLIVKLFLLPLK